MTGMTTAGEQGAAMPDWAALEARVSGAGIPVYRRAWFLSLIRQGREADLAGRAHLAAHCHARVEKELDTWAAAHPAASPAAPSPASASPAPASPLADLAARRGSATRARYLELLARHDARLSPAEREAYRAALDPAEGAQGAQGAEAAPVSDLRRRLVDRLLRSARYRRQGARLAAWRPAAALSDDPPAGPYNDYRALEEILHRLAAAQPEWAAEFLDVYAGMRETRLAYGEMLPGK